MSWDDPPPTQQANKKLPGGLQDQGHEVVHHDQGEDGQQPKTFRIGSGCQVGVRLRSKIPYSC